MSKHWKPAKPTVALSSARPSRIRREPVRLAESVAAAKPRTAVRTRKQEMWGSVAGILFFATLIVVAIAGVAVATIFNDDPAEDARAQQYDQCYNGGQNCVVDGSTIYVAGEKVVIARVDAPRIQGASCPAESDRGIDTAVRLANRLNTGEVTLGTPFRDAYGRQVRSVEVKGQDVASWMISTGIAREYLGGKSNWCGVAS